MLELLILVEKVLKKRIHGWLENLSSNLELGRFSFCLKGNLVPTSKHAASMATVFAAKIAYQTGLWSTWSQKKKDACIAFMLSFQDEDGWVRDPWILDYYDKHPEVYPCLQETIRAETRQLLSLLITLGAKPLYAPPLEYDSPENLIAFIRSFDWSNPWAAASHWSHQAFLIATSKAAGKDVTSLEAALFSVLDEYYHPECGLWFDSSQMPPVSNILINGAMKVFTGLQWLPANPMNHEPLVRFCLKTMRMDDSCSLLNQIYVLQEATTVHNEKTALTTEARNAAMRLARQTMRYYRWKEGAFSFYPSRAQHCYYAGIPTSKGLKTADLHGSAMQTWALALAMQFLGYSDDCGWAIQRV